MVKEIIMRSSELKSRFGEMLDNALRGLPTVIERRGRRVGTFVPIDEYEAYQDWKAQQQENPDERPTA